MKKFKLSLLLVAILTLCVVAFGVACTPVSDSAPEEPEEPVVEQVTDMVIEGFGTFTGTLVDGIPSGEGKVVTEEFTYEGTFEDGFRITGNGVKAYANGQVSTGTFVNGALNGYGTHDYANGCIGMGLWSNGAMNGTMWFTWGQVGGPYEVYIGEWKDGIRFDDDAFYTFNNGCWYRGAFNDWINGEGEFHWTNGNFWKGNFVGGNPEKGTYGFGQMDGVQGYIWVDAESGAWSWYNGQLEDGTVIENGQVKEAAAE